MHELIKFDDWLMNGGPAALVTQELLEPVNGPDSVFFPPTYAASEDKKTFPGGYNINHFPDGSNVCLVDSVGSQANRIEPLFSKQRYCSLVPQINIRAGEKTISILDVGHRAGDALVRFSKAGEVTWSAFQSLLSDGNAEPMARVAPTSLLFGVWDSRGSQVKIPRALRSTIRAYNVRVLTRSAQFRRATDFVEEGLISEEIDKGRGEDNPLSREGFNDSPATGTHGGVCGGEIRRETTINLSAIRRLRVSRNNDDSEENLKLRRYILGLALVAATATFDELFDLREGCQLRQKPGQHLNWEAVPYRGNNQQLPDLTESVALRFAEIAASSFVVGDSEEYTFDKAAAEKWLRLKKEEQDKRRRNNPMTKQFEDFETPTESEVKKASPANRARRAK